jgi:hypothetical protein
MPFRPGPTLPDYQSIKTILVQTKEQVQNPALYETILRLLDAAAKSQGVLSGNIASSNEGTAVDITALEAAIAALEAARYATIADESVLLPNSRQLLAGFGIAFDDTVTNQRTINTTIGDLYYEPLTNGDLAAPELIFAAGDVIMVAIFP